MSTFDGALIGIVIACLICIIQIFPSEKGTRRQMIFIVGSFLLIISIIGICVAAKHFHWESAILGISASESSEATESTQSLSDVSGEIIANAKLMVEMQSDDCPKLVLQETEIFAGQTEYELVWEPFENYTEYKILIYERNGDVANLLSEYVATGHSYQLDISRFEGGKTYSINVAVADIHFSAPIIIEMKSFTE